jgi:hypothetical protein
MFMYHIKISKTLLQKSDSFITDHLSYTFSESCQWGMLDVDFQ